MKKEKSMNCKECQSYYYGYLEDKSNLPYEASNHIQICHNCQLEIKRLRHELKSSDVSSVDYKALLRKHLKLHMSVHEQWLSCRRVRPFMPALLIDFLHITQPTPVTLHLDQCRQCRSQLKQIQSLHLSCEKLIAAVDFLAGKNEDLSVFEDEAKHVLQAIRNAEESGVVTRMQKNVDSAESLANPIPMPASPAKARHPHQAVSTGRLRSINYLLTGGIAVAASILLVVMLLPTAASGNLKSVSQAIKSVDNIHLQRFSDKGELIQEIWMSRPLGFKIYKQPQTTFFKDVHTGRIVQIQPGGEPVYLSEGVREEDMYARLLPFDQLKDLPSDFEWTYIADKVLKSGQHVKLYELTWENTISGRTISKKWRASLDPETHLPYYIEWLEQIGDETEFHTITTSIVAYPSETKCLEQLKQEGLQRFLKVDHVE
jgi:hypothetical protein